MTKDQCERLYRWLDNIDRTLEALRTDVAIARDLVKQTIEDKPIVVQDGIDLRPGAINSIDG